MISGTLERAALRACLASLLLTSGCATITGSEIQNISILTYDGSGPVSDAECQLRNDKGKWTVKAPGTAAVRRSAEDLLVRCEKEAQVPGTAKVVSKVNAALFGNAIFGGVVGAVIDHTRGTAYDYPSPVEVLLGANRVINGGEVSTSAVAPDPGEATRPRELRGAATLQDLDGLLKGR